MITHFTIFGERNSGTNHLKFLLCSKLKLKFTKKYGFKHWYIKDHYPRGRANQTTDNECLKSIENNNNTLFVYIVRNPYDWCGAMRSKPHHIKENKSKNLFEFISNRYIAYEDNLPGDHEKDSISPWYKDDITNKYFIEEAGNIIQLRNMKNEHFNNLQNKVKYFYIIRQEHLIDDINKMIELFNLKVKDFDITTNYRKPKTYNIDEKSRDFINTNLNNHIDNELYLI